ncbi:MAG: YdgA family protein, partial [Azoarcus sp.]|nr:YdgA family protein [Azoarcus sp.]
MKTPVKIAIAAITAVVLALAYTAAAWFSGKSIEDNIDSQIAYTQKLLPGVIKVEKTSERGIFSSTRSMVYTFDYAELDRLTISVRSNIRHSLFAGGPFAAGASDDTFTLEGLPPEIAKQLEGKPLTSHSVYYYGGGARSIVTIPAFALDIPSEHGVVHVAFDNLTAESDFSAKSKPEFKMTAYRYKGTLAALRIGVSNGYNVELKELDFDGNQKRAFDDNDYYFLGPQKLNVASFTVSNASGTDSLRLEKIAYAADSRKKDDFASGKYQLSAETIEVDKQNFGPAHFDLALDHLHAPSVSALYRGIMDLGQANAKGNLDDKATQAAMAIGMMALTTPLFELLEQGPEITLDRVSFNTPQGPVALTARTTIKDFKKTDIAGNAWLQKLDATAEASAPNDLLT